MATKYIREFIELNQDDKGFSANGGKISGTCKVQIIGDKIKLKIYVQNARKLTSNKYTTNILLADRPYLDIGELKVDNSGRADFKYEGNILDAANVFKGVAILTDDTLSRVGFKSPLVGYIKEKINWKNYAKKNYENKKDNQRPKEEIKSHSEFKAIKEEKKEVKNSYNEVHKKEVPSQKESVSNVKKFHLDINDQLNNNETQTDNTMTPKPVQTDEDTYSVKSDNNINLESQIANEDTKNHDYYRYQEEFIKNKMYNEDYYDPQNKNEEVQTHTRLMRDKEKSILDNMFVTYPELRPFETKGEKEKWIKIEPKDISVLPLDTWKMMNNPFLINGYYAYSHLLLGQLTNEMGEEIYVLGVPAQYHPKQRRIANMNGFKKFKCCRDQKAFVGEYGYWLLEITI